MMKPKPYPKTYWSIAGKWSWNRSPFLYTGIWRTRREAIKSHTEQLGKPWDYCRAKGDRAIKVLVKPL